MSSKEKKKAVKDKRKAEKKRNKPAGGGARKPKRAPSLKRKKSSAEVCLTKLSYWLQKNGFEEELMQVHALSKCSTSTSKGSLSLLTEDEGEGGKVLLAENGDCGVFAIALLRALAVHGIYDASFVVIADADDYEGGYPIAFDSFYDMDIFHVCIDVDEKYYDIRGERDIEEMLRNFVPYGGGGIEPGDYIPTDGRDYVADTYGVPSDGAIDFLEKFVLSSTNVKTSVENYISEAEVLAEKIISSKSF